MRLFPYYKVIIDAKLTEQELINKFNMIAFLDTNSSYKFHNEEVGNKSFSTYFKNILFNISIRINGKLKGGKDEKKHIELTFFLSEGVFVMFVLSTILLSTLFFIVLFGSPESWINLYPLLFFIIGMYFFFTVPFYFLVKKSLTLIRSHLTKWEVISL